MLAKDGSWLGSSPQSDSAPNISVSFRYFRYGDTTDLIARHVTVVLGDLAFSTYPKLRHRISSRRNHDPFTHLIGCMGDEPLVMADAGQSDHPEASTTNLILMTPPLNTLTASMRASIPSISR